ncbi:MAG: hypothetical protein IH608_02330 [Proteobacteria bacterium]|nr:hypothetical protein [Pseudomonadota bacterium]
MSTVRVRVLVVPGLLVLVLCGAAFSWYVVQRLRSLAAEALAHGEAMADAFGTALGPLLERMDTAGVRALVQAAGVSPVYGTVAVVGRASGRVVASQPPLPEVVEPKELPSCAGCHGQERELPYARLVDGGEGAESVRVFRSLPRGPSCRRCHTGENSVLGYLLLDVPISSRFRALRAETGQVLAMGLVTILALLGLAYRFLTTAVVRPLEQLRAAAEAGERGQASLSLPEGVGRELASVGHALQAAAGRRAATTGELRALGEHLRQRSSQVANALNRLREEGVLEEEGARAILEAITALNGSLGETGASLRTITSSTTDNSASLIELSASVDEVARTADHLAQEVTNTAAAVVEMVQSVVEVGGRVEVLAGETETTASSMAQINSSTRQIEQNAREAVHLSGRMGEAAQEGSAAVQATLEGIHASHGVIQETARAVTDLAEASQAIGGVVKIINEINDKTKLLALNAAIIAAQAGEHGKSFAVVAHEIKGLSDRTAASTGEIARINRGIGQRMAVAAEAVSKGQEATARNVALSERAGRALERILSTVRVSHDMAQEILVSTEEQTRGNERVMASMGQVTELVAHIRHAAREHRVTGEQVNAGTEVMRSLTEQVKLATAEQAEVSRYLSEAIAAVDHNLRGLLMVLEEEGEQAETILGHARRLQEQSSRQEEGVRSVEGAMEDLQVKMKGLTSRIGDLGTSAVGEG